MIWIRLGAILGGLGVAAGAFGAHGLEGRVDAHLLEVFETGARYHLYHALALLAVGGVATWRPAGRATTVAGVLFAIGIAVFSGSLYLMTLTGQRWLGAITPIGGVSLIAAWFALAVAAAPNRQGAS